MPDTVAVTVSPASEAASTVAVSVAFVGSGVGAFSTVTVTGADVEARKLAGSAGANEAVSAWVPAARTVVVNEAVPCAETIAVPSVAAPASKVTVPAAAGATVAVTVTASPTVTDDCDTAAVVVVGAATGAGACTVTAANESRLRSDADRPCAAEVATW